MKKLHMLYIPLAILVFCCGGCKKNSTVSYSIEGTWELRQKSGMITTDYPPGNGDKLKFTSSGYEKYQNNQLQQSGSYTIVDDNTAPASTCLSLPEGKFTKRIIYDGQQNAQKIFVDRADNKLSFISGCYAIDAGHTELYEKTGE